MQVIPPGQTRDHELPDRVRNMAQECNDNVYLVGVESLMPTVSVGSETNAVLFTIRMLALRERVSVPACHIRR